MTSPERSRADPFRRAGTQWIVGVLLFVAIACARLTQVAISAPEGPYYDEWIALQHIALPLAVGRFDPVYLAQPHNQHALFFTKLLTLGALVADDHQFDNRAVCLATQLLFSALAALLIVFAGRALGAGRSRFIAAALAVCMIPYAWENIPMGWGNPYMFLVAASVWLLWLASTRQSATAMLVAALASALSMASGTVAPLVALGILVLRWCSGDLRPRRAVLLGLPLLLAIAVGTWIALSGRLGGQPATPGWQQAGEVLVLALLWLPAWVQIARLIRGPTLGRTDLVFAGVALWGFLQFLVIVGLRDEFRLWVPTPRYLELFAVAVLANFGCGLRLARQWDRRWLVRVAVSSRIALTVFLLLLLLASPLAFTYFQARSDVAHAGDAAIADYVHGHDAAALDRHPNPLIRAPILYPDHDRLRAWLDDPALRQVLGDRLGTRPQPAPLVTLQRGFTAWLERWREVVIGLGAALALVVIGWSAWSARSMKP